MKSTQELVDWLMGEPEPERGYYGGRSVPSSEIRGCPTTRLDARHYIPMHRTWEHFTKNPTPTRKEVIRAFQAGRMPEEEFRKAAEVI